MYLTRAGSEEDLAFELGKDASPRRLAEGVVLANRRPIVKNGAPTAPAFARQAMRVHHALTPLDTREVAENLTKAMRRATKNALPRWSLQVVAPDSKDPLDPRRRLAETWGEHLEKELQADVPADLWSRKQTHHQGAEVLVQVWVVQEEEAWLGATGIHDALSGHPGGKTRLRRNHASPSRSGLKLEEAVEWLGIGPETGDRIADLGAAPGGWSQVAIKRGAHVIAIDPARIKVALPKKKFTHQKQSAFDFVPDETLDWMLCDMAWRPREVAKLIAKWGRRAWARQLLVNFKLPMKKKAAILQELLTILESAGWRGIRARQLYYDRDEVTVFAWLDPKIVIRGPQAPFQLRSRKNFSGPPQSKRKRTRRASR